MPLYYNPIHTKLKLIYIRKHLVNDLEKNNVYSIEWGKTESKEKTKKKTNQRKIKSIIRNMCGSP